MRKVRKAGKVSSSAVSAKEKTLSVLSKSKLTWR